MAMPFRYIQRSTVLEILRCGGKDLQHLAVPRRTPTCVFLMKTSRNSWSFVTVCLKYRLPKVYIVFLPYNDQAYLNCDSRILRKN